MSSSFDDRLGRIGFRWAGAEARQEAGPPPDIEETLLDVIETLGEDGRLFSVLLSWVLVHGNYVIVDKLRKLARKRPGGTSPWLAAVAGFAVAHRMWKWRPLARRLSEPKHFFPTEVSEGAIAMKGAVPYLEALNILVPNGSLRIREADVASARDLAALHPQYRNRYLYGPSWRADILTAIEAGAKNPTEIMQRVGCSYEPAHRVFRELQISGVIPSESTTRAARSRRRTPRA